MKKILSKSLDDTSQIARDWLCSLLKNKAMDKGKNGAKNGGSALIVGLSGNLGSGKTAFVKAVAAALGITEHVTSPTFVIEKIYGIKDTRFPWRRLIHIDAYRLESARELEVLDFEELAEDANNLILIEWPENVQKILPEATQTISCESVSEMEREYRFE